jgi:hypothetical protein
MYVSQYDYVTSASDRTNRSRLLARNRNPNPNANSNLNRNPSSLKRESTAYETL